MGLPPHCLLAGIVLVWLQRRSCRRPLEENLVSVTEILVRESSLFVGFSWGRESRPAWCSHCRLCRSGRGRAWRGRSGDLPGAFALPLCPSERKRGGDHWKEKENSLEVQKQEDFRRIMERRRGRRRRRSSSSV